MKIHLADGAEVVMDDAMIMPRDHAQAYALSFPGAYAEHPWGQTVIKVKRKVFLFVNGAIAPEDGVSLSVKLPRNASLHRCLRCIPFRTTMSHGSVIGAARCSRARETAPRNVLLVLLGWCLAQMSFHARRQDSPLALLSSFK